jgi:hypothetical protein
MGFFSRGKDFFEIGHKSSTPPIIPPKKIVEDFMMKYAVTTEELIILKRALCAIDEQRKWDEFYGTTLEEREQKAAKEKTIMKERDEQREKEFAENRILWRRLGLKSIKNSTYNPYLINAPRQVYPREWTEELRTKIRKRDNFVCQRCFVSAQHVHHIDFNKLNCNEDNLITTCNKCNLDANDTQLSSALYFKELLALRALIYLCKPL